MTRDEMFELLMKYASKPSDENVRKLLSWTDWYFVHQPELGGGR